MSEESKKDTIDEFAEAMRIAKEEQQKQGTADFNPQPFDEEQKAEEESKEELPQPNSA